MYLEKIIKDNYCILQMNRPKVNALNMDLVEEIRSTFKEIEADENLDGVILTGMSNVFTAGLDLVELFDYDKAKMETFTIAFGEMYIELVKFSKPFICAINGHAPAGGTVIAMGADYRVMAKDDQFKIGLNEVAVNIQISQNLITGYVFWMGQQQAYKNILNGKLLNPTEAYQAGLVDEIVNQDLVLKSAEKQMLTYLNFNKNIFKATKAKLRANWIRTIRDDVEQDLVDVMKVWWSPAVREKMEHFKQMLQAKKSSKTS